MAENVFLNQEPVRGRLPFINRARQLGQTRALIDQFGLGIDPAALVRDLPMDVQKMVQIIKAVSKDARVLLMDEPTSSLTASEVDLLLSFMHGLTVRGVGVVFISHYLPEVFRVCDRITVLREGAVVRSVARAETDVDETIRAMIGRTIQAEEARSRAPGAREVFAVRGLSVRRRLFDVSLEVHEGEVLGVTGLIGSGTTELAKAMFRSEDVTVESGEYRRDGAPVNLSGTSAAVRRSMAFVPNDRKTEGLFNRFSVMDNICMAGVDRYAGPLGLLDRRRMRDTGTKYIEALAIKTPGTDTPVENLSGGNQQKVLLAKWLATEPQRPHPRRADRRDRRRHEVRDPAAHPRHRGPRRRRDPHHLRDRGAGEALHQGSRPVPGADRQDVRGRGDHEGIDLEGFHGRDVT